ncbi:hypothetical protein CTEN210_15940 [Chaetoceros tenuissimus]|uniref:MYND-type domain-containing protein n=1 Tax=Chaetoceros tenuissimus TaxID=426638 RepID=A0AAD3HDQ6_9STRA|nr:hypothetical protein CTEN210_15940 [Chaetoceros tenuissimus]
MLALLDVFFCNRDCQVKHWKTHKAFCGKSAIIVDLSSSSNVREREFRQGMRKFNESSFRCEHCLKNCEELGYKLRVCSKCDLSRYCSRECQVAHWQSHKETCKAVVANREEVAKDLTPAEARIWNLLERQWRFKNDLVLSDLVLFALRKEDIEEQPPTKIAHIQVEFNYNLQTFLLAEDPKTLPTSYFHHERILEMYQEVDNRNRMSEEKVNAQFGLVTCKDLGQICSFYHPVVYPSDFERKCDRSTVLYSMMKGPLLKSDIFQVWKTIRDRNFQRQIEHLKQSPLLSTFLQNALHLFSEKPKHLTHGIKFHLKLGKEPGEIAEIVEYKVKTISDIRDRIARLTSKQEQQKLKRGFDVRNNPRLLESRKRDPNNVMIVISFSDSSFTEINMPSMFALESVFLPWNNSRKGTVNKCKRAAEGYFRQLQGLVKKMPSHFVEKVSV